jgi:hypothetical protein
MDKDKKTGEYVVMKKIEILKLSMQTIFQMKLKYYL